MISIPMARLLYTTSPMRHCIQRSRKSRQAPERAIGRATISHEDAQELLIDADASRDGFLLLADTYYPGWFAEVDGRPAPVYRANLMLRAVRCRAGTTSSGSSTIRQG